MERYDSDKRYEQEINEIIAFCDEANLSGEDLMAAYELSLGASSEAIKQNNIEYIRQLATLLKHLLNDQGLPVNKIPELARRRSHMKLKQKT